MNPNLTDLGFRLYPRGFLGGSISPQVSRTPKPFAEQTNMLHYEVNKHDKKGSTVVPNPHVEALYATHVKNFVKIGSPDFRKAVLEVALDAFGTNNFLVWLVTQYSNKIAGDIHSSFLLDTLKFISTGRRDMALETWGALIHMKDEGNNIGAIPDKVKEFFGVNRDSPIDAARINIYLVDVLQEWCSKANGLEDLLGTLHILFGDY